MVFLLHSGQGQHQLSVTDGYGGGTYSAGETVHVFAKYDLDQEVVTGWESNTEIGTTDGKLGLEGEWHFSFEMPAADVTVMPRPREFLLKREQLTDLTLKSSKGEKTNNLICFILCSLICSFKNF